MISIRLCVFLFAAICAACVIDSTVDQAQADPQSAKQKKHIERKLRLQNDLTWFTIHYKSSKSPDDKQLLADYKGMSRFAKKRTLKGIDTPCITSDCSQETT